MSQARDIYALIQKERDRMKSHWRTFGERYETECARDKMCEDLQAKIAEVFPDEFPQQQKGAGNA